MIEVNKIKVGDKLRVVADYLKGIGVDEIVEVVPFVPDDYWINGGFVDINYLEGEEEAFELIEDSEAQSESETFVPQKIKVLTGDYEYQGLYKDSIHTLIGYEGDEYTSFCVFKHNGKTWKIDEQQCELVEDSQYYKELDKLFLPAKYLDPNADEETKKMLSAFKQLIKKCGIEKDCVIFPGTAEDKQEAIKSPKKATEFLSKALSLLEERGKDYDQPEGERSMGKTVIAFNAITGHNLKESDGWLILQLLKDVRQNQNRDSYHADSAEDCISYAALKAEALAEGK